MKEAWVLRMPPLGGAWRAGGSMSEGGRVECFQDRSTVSLFGVDVGVDLGLVVSLVQARSVTTLSTHGDATSANTPLLCFVRFLIFSAWALSVDTTPTRREISLFGCDDSWVGRNQNVVVAVGFVPSTAAWPASVSAEAREAPPLTTPSFFLPALALCLHLLFPKFSFYYPVHLCTVLDYLLFLRLDLPHFYGRNLKDKPTHLSMQSSILNIICTDPAT